MDVLKTDTIIWDNETVITPSSENKTTLLGISFAGGFGLGFVFYILYHLLLRWIFERDAHQNGGSSPGVCNLAYVGDDASPVVDNPPDYASVVSSGTDEGSGTFWSRLIRRFVRRKSAQEELPPSYDAAVEEERSRNQSTF